MFGYLLFGALFAGAFGGGNKDKGLLEGIAGGIATLVAIKASIKQLRGKDDSDKNDKDKAEDKEEEKEVRAIIKKKPEDMTPSEKNKLKDWQSSGVLDYYLSDNDWKKVEDVTGVKHEKTEDKKEQPTLQQACIAQLQEINQLGEITEPSEKEQYDLFLKCAFDKEGNLLNDEDRKKAFEELPEKDKTTFSKLGDSLSKADKSELNNIASKLNSVSADDAKAALEQSAIDRIKVTTKEELNNLDKEKNEKIAKAESIEEKRKIAKEYKEKSEQIQSYYDAKQKEHKSRLNAIKNTPKNKAAIEEIKNKNKELQQQLDDISKEGYDKELMQKYKDYKLSNADNEALKNKDSEEYKKLKEKLELEGLNISRLEAVQQADYEPDSNIREKLLKKQQEAITAEVTAKQNKLQKSINDNNEKIKKLNDSINSLDDDNTSTKSDTNTDTKGKADENTAADAKKDFKPKKDDIEWYPELDDDGDPTGKYSISVKIGKDENGEDEIKYVMRDSSGEEIDITEEDFESAKKKYNDTQAELEDDTSTEEEGDDIEDEEGEEETDDKGEKTGKKVLKNPSKVWHKKKNKRTGKPTKSYFNKKGDSISPKEFSEKMKHYKERLAKKSNNESLVVHKLKRFSDWY